MRTISRPKFRNAGYPNQQVAVKVTAAIPTCNLKKASEDDMRSLDIKCQDPLTNAACRGCQVQLFCMAPVRTLLLLNPVAEMLENVKLPLLDEPVFALPDPEL